MSKPSYTTYIRHRVERHRARSARRREGPRHHDRPRSDGASGFRQHPAEFLRLAVSRLRRPAEIQGPQRARPRPRASEGRGGEVEARRRVHDRALARHPDALHHQPALSDRGGLRRRAGRDDEDRVSRHRRSGLHPADRLPRSRLLPQQPVPRSDRRRIPQQDRRAQYRGTQRRDRRPAGRPDAAAHLLGQLRRPAQLRPAAA